MADKSQSQSSDERAGADLSEQTPLLAGQGVATTTDPTAAEATTTRSKDDTPIPTAQILLLCWARTVEPIAFFSIFPFINQMVRDNGGLDDADVGFYSGLIESLFSLTQMLVMIAWGRAADRFGRKPVLVVSLAGVSVATAAFGFAQTIWQMILVRCVAGVFAGTIVTIRTMLAEHSTAKTQARVFAWFSVGGNVGILVGPLLGGALANPAKQYGGAFRDMPFFQQYPYALSTIVTGTLGAIAALTTAVLVKETLSPAAKKKQQTDSKAGSTWSLLKAPGVGMVLYLYGHVMLLAFAYTAVAPVAWFTPVAIGGLGFSELQISLFMALNGFAQAIWLLLVFPRVQRRLSGPVPRLPRPERPAARGQRRGTRYLLGPRHLVRAARNRREYGLHCHPAVPQRRLALPADARHAQCAGAGTRQRHPCLLARRIHEHLCLGCQVPDPVGLPDLGGARRDCGGIRSCHALAAGERGRQADER